MRKIKKLIALSHNSIFMQKIKDSFIGYMSFSLLSMFFSFICAKLFGAELFGEYTYVITIILMLSIFVKVGMDNSLIYFIVREGTQYNTAAFFISFFLTIIVVAVIWNVSTNNLLFYALPLIYIIVAQDLFFGMYKAQGKIKEYYIIKIFYNILVQIILLLLFYILFEPTTLWILGAFFIGNTLAMIIYFSKNINSFSSLYIDKSFISYSFPMMFISFVGVLMNRIDIIMIGQFLGNIDVGIYQVSAQIATSISIFIGIFNIAFAPKIAQLYKSKKIDELSLLYIKSTRILAAIGILLLIIIILFSNNILSYFGSEYLTGNNVLIYRSIGQFFVVAVGSVGFMLSMIGKVKHQMYRILFASVINIILNYLLIPFYGIEGAAIASLIALLFSSMIGYYLVYKTFKTKVYRFF